MTVNLAVPEPDGGPVAVITAHLGAISGAAPGSVATFDTLNACSNNVRRRSG